MSQRFDAPWISGAHLFGQPGYGVLAENIPSTGDSGPSYLYNDITLPDDAGKEVCGRITTWPSAGTLFAYEDGSFEFVGAPDGAYSFAYQLYVDGMITGAPAVVDLLVGESSLNASASGSNVASGSASLSAQVALASVGVSTASGSAALAASVPLSAVGLSVAAGSAIPSATVTISASGLAQAAGQAGLSASVLAQAAGAALASGNATLAAQLNALATGAAQAGGSANLSGGAAGSLSASGSAIAAGTAVLSVTVGLQAAGSALASGSATGSANAPGQVSAAGGAEAGGSGVMSARVSITAAGFVQAMGQGAFSATVPLSAFGAVTASGYAHLTVDNGVVMVRAPSGYRTSLIAYNSMRPRQSITIRPISLNTRR